VSECECVCECCAQTLTLTLSLSLSLSLSQLHSDKQQISIGFIGYPNVGKSSVINTLKGERSCKTAPMPGETKVWQYVSLMRRIYLIDCPGVVHGSGDSETDIVLKGILRVENIEAPEDHIKAILERVKPEYITRTYGITDWSPDDHLGFLEQLAHKCGRLLKKGEADIGTVAKTLLYDWQRGKIPFYNRPPDLKEGEAEAAMAAAEKAGVAQDFRSITVSVNFFGEDLKGDLPRAPKNAAPEDTPLDMEDDVPEGAAGDLTWEDLEGSSDEEDAEAMARSAALKRKRVPAAHEEEEEEMEEEEEEEDDEGAGAGAEEGEEEEEEEESEEEAREPIRKKPALPSKTSKNRPVVSLKQVRQLERKRVIPAKESDRLATGKSKARNYYDDVNIKGRKRTKPGSSKPTK
jgi:nuclear GTP-binding protein